MGKSITPPFIKICLDAPLSDPPRNVWRKEVHEETCTHLLESHTTSLKRKGQIRSQVRGLTLRLLVETSGWEEKEENNGLLIPLTI